MFISCGFLGCIDEFLSSNWMGKTFLFYGISYPFMLFAALLAFLRMRQKKETDSLKEWGKSVQENASKVTFFALMVSMMCFAVFLAGTALYLIEAIPYIGPVLKVIFCAINFLFLSLERLFVLFIPASLHFSLILLQKNKSLNFRNFIEELSGVNQKLGDVILRFFKAVYPFTLAAIFFFTVQNDVVYADHQFLRAFLKLILAVPMAFVLAPFANYFFLATVVLEEKSKAKESLNYAT